MPSSLHALSFLASLPLATAEGTAGSFAIELAACGVVILLLVIGCQGGRRSFKHVRRETEDLDGWEAEVALTRRNNPEYGPARLLFTVFGLRRHKEDSEQGGAQDAVATAESMAAELVRAVPESLTLLEERLLLITSMMKDSNKVSVMPHISELHDLSLQRMESERAAKWLGLCSSVILICGIWGTLWSVHCQISHMGAQTLGIGALAHCLWPSAVAVIANVALIAMRHVIAAKLDRHLERLDEITLSLFMPALQPESGMGQLLDRFRDFQSGREDARLDFYRELPTTLAHAMQSATEGVERVLDALRRHADRVLKLSLAAAEVVNRQAWQQKRLRALSRQVRATLEAGCSLRKAEESTELALGRLEAGLGSTAASRDAAVAYEGSALALRRLSPLVASLGEWKTCCRQLVEKSSRLLADLGELHRRVVPLTERASTLDDDLQWLRSDIPQQACGDALYSLGDVARAFQRATTALGQATALYDAQFRQMTPQICKGMELASRAASQRERLVQTSGSLAKAEADFKRDGKAYIERIRWEVVLPVAFLILLLLAALTALSVWLIPSGN